MTDLFGLHPSQTATSRLSRRNFLTRAGAIGLSAVLAQSMMLTPGAAALSEMPLRGGHLKIGLHGGDFSNTLNPALAAAPVPSFNLRTIGDTLVEVTSDGGLEMRLAEEVNPSPDGMAWHLRIRKNVRFHDGSPLTPEDVRATLEWHRNPANASGALVHLMGIESIAIDGDWVVVYMLQPDFYFAQGLGDVCLTITAAGRKEKQPIFSGGYQVELNEPGVRHQFTRFKDYWDESRAHLDQIEVLVINDPVLRAATLAAGQVHIASNLDPVAAAALVANSDVRLARAQGAELHSFGMQLNVAPYDNMDLRMALRYAIDRKGILDSVLRGQGVLGNDLPFAPGLGALAQMIPQRAYDPDLAQFHYRKARLDGAPIILRVSDMAFPHAQKAAAIFKASARAAKIPLEVRHEEGDLYWSEVWNRQPFTASATPIAASTALAFSGYRSGAVWNTTRFGSSLFDEALIRMRGIADPAARRQAEYELAMILHTEGGMIAPVRADVIDAYSGTVRGFTPSATGGMMGGFAGTKLWLS